MSEQRGAAIGRMVQEKDASYGNAYPRVARALKALLEAEGVDAGTPLKLSEAQLAELPYVTRLLEKAARVLHGGPKALGEDAWVDVAGIALARLADKERADEAWVRANVQPTKESPKLVHADWVHLSTGTRRVACLENIDAPSDWNRAYSLTSLIAVTCPYCLQAFQREQPVEKKA